MLRDTEEELEGEPVDWPAGRKDLFLTAHVENLNATFPRSAVTHGDFVLSTSMSLKELSRLCQLIWGHN